MFISVVIATRNRRVLLMQTLEALARQTWPRDRFEVIVADNGSTDGTRAAVESAALRPDLPTIRYVFVAQPGKSFAVNAAMNAATGDLLALTDDDVEPSPTWLERLTGAIVDADVEFAAGRIVPAWESAAPRWLSPALYGVLAIADNGVERRPIARGLNEHIMPIGANMAIRSAVIGRVGGFRTDLGKLDGSLRTGEDHEFFLRLLHAGCRGIYEPEAVVAHFVPVARLDRQYFRRWLYQNGQDVAKVEGSFESGLPQLLGIPRYLWRHALRDLSDYVIALLRRDEAGRVAARLKLVWFAGYLRTSWFGRRSAIGPATAFVEGE